MDYYIEKSISKQDTSNYEKFNLKNNEMETKSMIRTQKITLADVMSSVEVLSRKQLKQIKGGDNDPDGPIKK